MTVELARTYGSIAEAERLRAALASDQPEYLVTRRSGRSLAFRIASASARSARATVDDLLACLSAAERSLGIPAAARPPAVRVEARER